MKINNNFKAIFALSLVVTLLGALLKIEHLGYSQPFLIIGVLLTLAYIVLGIIEVQNSSKIKSSEKVMWTIGFIALSFFTAIVYLVSGRKRIV
ncbi:hypothetical protein [Flavobacterium sp.]|uniref:hypothetical protein n=1 Tax=Flavobacterium sp. TaxID=239 RepID=UPI002FDA8A8B